MDICILHHDKSDILYLIMEMLKVHSIGQVDSTPRSNLCCTGDFEKTIQTIDRTYFVYIL